MSFFSLVGYNSNMKSSLIKKIQKTLKNFFTYSKTESIMVVSMDKSEMPFAYIIEDDSYPDMLLISFAVNFPLANVAAEMVLKLNSVKSVAVTESFYISNAGQTFWGTEAVDRFHVDNFIDLESLKAASEVLN